MAVAVTLPAIQQVVITIPDGSGGVNPITIDACVTESHSLTNTLTDNPVEQGAPITDHSRPEPRKITLDCVVSNTPLVGNNGDGYNYAFNAWQQFVTLWQQPQLVTVSTIRDYYPSMGIESVTSTVDAKTSQILKFTVALKQVRVVQNKLTQIVVSKSKKAQPSNSQGGVTPTPTKAPPVVGALTAAINGAKSVISALGF